MTWAALKKMNNNKKKGKDRIYYFSCQGHNYMRGFNHREANLVWKRVIFTFSPLMESSFLIKTMYYLNTVSTETTSMPYKFKDSPAYLKHCKTRVLIWVEGCPIFCNKYCGCHGKMHFTEYSQTQVARRRTLSRNDCIIIYLCHFVIIGERGMFCVRFRFSF